jgi:predicted O-methyltransferase YrrM
MIEYIGDISKKDATVLRMYAQTSNNILEFGCGASTQVIANYVSKEARITSIDTEEAWIEKTRSNIKVLGIKNHVNFLNYNTFMDHILVDIHFDFIFDDGADSLRREFAIKMWPYLAVGGVIGFHDTRRGPDFRNVLEVLAHYQNEVDDVAFNVWGSNITMIWKKVAEPYDNWQITEKREPWQLGYGELPEEFINKFKK